MSNSPTNTLFDPLAHRDDPLSSYTAAGKALKSGKLKGQMKLCLLGVQRWPGKTSAELAVLIGVDRYCPGRRLSVIERRGLVKKGKARRCTVCRSICVTWSIPEIDKYPLLHEKE